MTNPKEMDERGIVRRLGELFSREKGTYGLKKVITHTNLATKKFVEIWYEWWKGEVPPKVEVDMILVFESRSRDPEPILAGIEVEYFKGKTKRFYDGLQQAIAFSLFGFDSTVLWHVFPEYMEDRMVERYVRPMNELIEGLKLPLVYIATKIVGSEKFEFFAPLKLYSSKPVDVKYLISYLRNLCEGAMNPLITEDDVVRRRNIMKALLSIPV